MNWLLSKSGGISYRVANLVLDILGMFYLALKDIVYLREPGKRRIFWHLFKRYFYNAGFRAASVNTLIAILLGWILILIATRFLPEGAALGEFFQNFYVIASIREIGPLVSGMILISRSANAVTADVGYLKISGEFEVLQSLRLNPFLIFLMPVFFAFPISLLLMFFYFNTVCILSSYFFLAVHSGAGIGLEQFVGGIVEKITLLEIFVSVGKAVLGGSLIGIISIYFGARVVGGYDAVSRAISNSTTIQIFAFVAVNLSFSYMAYR
ncbi:MAG: ABC transporter permease [Halioglobus sp.]